MAKGGGGNYDGSIKINTTLDTKQFDKDYEELEKKISKLDNKTVTIKTDIGTKVDEKKVEKQIDESIKKTDEIIKKRQLKNKVKTMKIAPKPKPYEDTSGMTFTLGGKTYDSKGADEYFEKLKEINKEQEENQKKEIEIPDKTIKKATELKNETANIKEEIKDVKDNISNIPTQDIEKIANEEKKATEETKKYNEETKKSKKIFLRIPTKIETDKFDKQIAKLDEKIQKKEKEKIRLETDIKNIKESEKGYDELIKKYDEYEGKKRKEVESWSKLKQEQQDLFEVGTNKLKDYRDIPKYEEYSAKMKEAEQNVKNLEIEMEKTSKEMGKWDTKLTNNANKIENLKAKQSEITEEVKRYKNQIESVKLEKQQAQVDSIKKNFDGVSKSVGKAIGRVARLALGVISIASAYRFVSQASSTLGQYDEQYATNLEYIRYLIAQTIAPALKYVVNLASTLLSYLNYILNAWFGITLFSKNSAKNFMNAKNSTSGISKNTSKIKSDLQTTPFDEMNVLSDTTSSGTSGTSGGGAIAPSIDPSMLTGEIPDWIKFIVEHKKEILAVMAGVASGLLAWQVGLKAIKALGIGILIAGIVYTIESLLDYLKDPSWENFGKIITGIGIIITGVGAIIASALGIAAGAPVIIAGILVAIVGVIVKHWEQIKSFFQNGIDWLRDKSDWVHNMFGDTIGDIYDTFVNNLQSALNIFDSFFTMIKGVLDGIIKFIKGVFTGDWKLAWEGIKQIFSSIFVGIANIFGNIIGIIKGKVINIGQTTGEVISNVFKAVVNAVLRTIEKVLNTPIRAVNSLLGVINALPGVKIPTLSTFNLPRLKVGGIINMPRKRNTSWRRNGSRRRSRT